MKIIINMNLKIIALSLFLAPLANAQTSLFYSEAPDFSGISANGGILNFNYTASDATAAASIGMPSTFAISYQLTGWTGPHSWAVGDLDVADRSIVGSSTATLTLLDNTLPAPTTNLHCVTMADIQDPSISLFGNAVAVEDKFNTGNTGTQLSAGFSWGDPVGGNSSPYLSSDLPTSFTLTYENEGITDDFTLGLISVGMNATRWGNPKASSGNIDIHCVPEPSSALLGLLALVGFVARRKRSC